MDVVWCFNNCITSQKFLSNISTSVRILYNSCFLYRFWQESANLRQNLVRVFDNSYKIFSLHLIKLLVRMLPELCNFLPKFKFLPNSNLLWARYYLWLFVQLFWLSKKNYLNSMMEFDSWIFQARILFKPMHSFVHLPMSLNFETVFLSMWTNR